jgi:hypothetical protein
MRSTTVSSPRAADPVLAKKSLAAVVIVVCLALQLHAIVRPAGARIWPFLDFPMYSDAHHEGDAIRMHELRGRNCGAPPTISTIHPYSLHLLAFRYRRMLRRIAADHSTAAELRRSLSHLVGTSVTPRPCALQVWERGVVVTRQGARPTNPQWQPVREWEIDDPATVRVLAP